MPRASRILVAVLLALLTASLLRPGPYQTAYAQEAVGVGVGVGDTSLNLSGKTSPHAIVTVMNGAAVIGTVMADGSGQYTKPFPAQDPGIMELRVFARDTTGLLTDTISLQVNLQEHFATSVQLFLPPSISLNPDNPAFGQEVIATGQTLPGSIVGISLDNHTVATATASSDGAWRVPVATTALAPGTHQVFATAVDTIGDQSYPTALRSFTTLQPPSTPPAAVKPPQQLTVPRITRPAHDIATTQSDITVAGQADPGSQIEVWSGSQPKGSVFADGFGNWSLTLPLQNGTNEIKARACDAGSCSDFSPTVTVNYTGSQALGQKFRAALNQYRFSTSTGKTIHINVSTANGTIPIFYKFIWGDGSNLTLRSRERSASASHTYREADKYSGKVEITDSEGRIITTPFAVQVDSTSRLTVSPWLLLAAVVIGLALYAFTGRLLKRGPRETS